MNAGQAITAAMRAQRAADFNRLGRKPHHYNLLGAYLQWGWFICKPGGLGRPGY